MLKPSYLKMMGKWAKKAQDFEQELRGKDVPCSFQGCVEQQPQAWLAAARGARGRAGEIRRGIRLFQSRRLPLHNALCRGACGTREGLGWFFGMGGRGGIKLCLPEGPEFSAMRGEGGEGAGRCWCRWGSRTMVHLGSLLSWSRAGPEQQCQGLLSPPCCPLPAVPSSVPSLHVLPAGARAVWEPRGGSADVWGQRWERNR